MTDMNPRLFPTAASKVTAVLAVICALALGAALGVVFRRTGTSTAAAQAKVVLEPITKVAQDAWVRTGVDLTSDPAATGAQYGQYTGASGTPDDRTTHTYATLAGRTVNGDSAGIYGGQRDQQVCDKNALTGFLTDPNNAAIAGKWAASLGLNPGQISNYIQGLTGARLRWDTRVTDSGISNGKVLTWQALLQAGTAVLVDDSGTPRVKCNSGSPLLSPQGLRSSTPADLSINQVAANPGDAWAGLNPRNAVTVQPGTQALQTVTIVDPSNNDLLQRSIGSDGASSRDVGTGDVQFNLKWAAQADLDPHLTAPDGTTFGFQEDYYQNLNSPAPDGGEHDVDFVCSSRLDQNGFAQENIFWPNHDAPAGTYRIFVRGWNTGCNSGSPQSVPFTLTVTINGQTTQYSGSVSGTPGGAQQDSQVWTFTKNS